MQLSAKSSRSSGSFAGGGNYGRVANPLARPVSIRIPDLFVGINDARTPQSQQRIMPACTSCAPQLGQDFRSHRGLSTPHVSQGKLGVQSNEASISPRLQWLNESTRGARE